MSLHDQAAGATHVLAQVVVEHGRDALPAQQGQVVCVEVVGDEGGDPSSGALEREGGRRVAATDGVGRVDRRVLLEHGGDRLEHCGAAPFVSVTSRTARSGAIWRIVARKPISRSSSPRKAELLTVTSTVPPCGLQRVSRYAAVAPAARWSMPTYATRRLSGTSVNSVTTGMPRSLRAGSVTTVVAGALASPCTVADGLAASWTAEACTSPGAKGGRCASRTCDHVSDR